MILRKVILPSDGLKIAGQLYLPGEGDGTLYPTVCVCHGIPSGNPPDPADGGYPALAETICRQGFAVLIFNFRGTGGSEGNLDILGWGRDLNTAISYLRTQPEVDPSCISLLGFSGGAAVSVYVASQDKRVSSVIACACLAEFSFIKTVEEPLDIVEHMRNIGAIRDEDFPHSVDEWIDGFRLVRPIDYVARISPRPLLLVHGSQDEAVDISHARRLFARAGEPKQLVIIEGGGHRLRQNKKAMQIVFEWLKSRYQQALPLSID